jgi:hypothetical protein
MSIFGYRSSGSFPSDTRPSTTIAITTMVMVTAEEVRQLSLLLSPLHHSLSPSFNIEAPSIFTCSPGAGDFRAAPGYSHLIVRSRPYWTTRTTGRLPLTTVPWDDGDARVTTICPPHRAPTGDALSGARIRQKCMMLIPAQH